METEIKIIKLFLEDKEQKTIRDIAKKIGSDYKITYTAAQRLIQKQVLISKSLGKSTICEMNQKAYNREIHEAEDERKQSLLKNKDIFQLQKEMISKMGSCFFILLVFGSYAKNKQTKTSDIDLMLISNKKDAEEDLSEMLSLLPLKIHSLSFTEDEFKRMKDSKSPNVVKETVSNNIILYGIENYYLLKNA